MLAFITGPIIPVTVAPASLMTYTASRVMLNSVPGANPEPVRLVLGAADRNLTGVPGGDESGVKTST